LLPPPLSTMPIHLPENINASANPIGIDASFAPSVEKVYRDSHSLALRVESPSEPEKSFLAKAGHDDQVWGSSSGLGSYMGSFESHHVSFERPPDNSDGLSHWNGLVSNAYEMRPFHYNPQQDFYGMRPDQYAPRYQGENSFFESEGGFDIYENALQTSVSPGSYISQQPFEGLAAVSPIVQPAGSFKVPVNLEAIDTDLRFVRYREHEHDDDYKDEDFSNTAVKAKKKKKVTDGKPRPKHVGKACVHCKKAHLACDHGRPCKRCIHLGKTDCVDVEHKRRGRPRTIPD
ncbi:hypothetical protein HDU91_003817, partial [Kappamyces sp. JEL0680]